MQNRFKKKKHFKVNKSFGFVSIYVCIRIVDLINKIVLIK